MNLYEKRKKMMQEPYCPYGEGYSKLDCCYCPYWEEDGCHYDSSEEVD